MRRALVFTVALALLSAPRAWSQSPGQAGKAPAAAADHSADDQALAKIMEDVQNALNNHNAKALAATFATDGDLRAADGAMVKGRAAIEKYYGVLFAADRFKDAKASVASTAENRYLGANVAIANATAEISGAKGLDGKDLPTYTQLVTFVAVKRNGTWQTLSARGWPANAMPGPAPKRKTS